MPIRKGQLVPAYVWEKHGARYRHVATGRFVSGGTIRTALEQALRAARADMDATSRLLQSGQINVAAWRESMAAQIKATHLYSAALPRGGWAQLTAADYGRVGRLVREQYRFLDRYARELAAGKAVNLGRARMYTNASRTSYHASERAEMLDQGKTQERNIRTASDSCAGCISETGRGWVAIGKLRPIGTRTCLTNCLCRIRYR